jgi:ketosteroid isomerase-like protein
MSKKITTGKTLKKGNPKLDPGLLKAHKAYEAAINSNDTDTVMAMYDKDAKILQPNLGHIVSGLAEIRVWVDQYFTAYKTHWKKVPIANFVCGDFGFDEGIDTAVDIPRGGDPTPIHSNCKGILIYKKQENGEWKIFRDIWNSNVEFTGLLQDKKHYLKI